MTFYLPTEKSGHLSCQAVFCLLKSYTYLLNKDFLYVIALIVLFQQAESWQVARTR